VLALERNSNGLDATRPLINLIINVRSDNIHVFHAFKLLAQLNQRDEVSVYLCLLDEGKAGPVLSDTSVSVTHDSNQHVEERDLSNERRHYEKYPHQILVRVELKFVHCKLSQAQQVLIYDRVDCPT
jgi:hypothetical protein